MALVPLTNSVFKSMFVLILSLVLVRSGTLKLGDVGVKRRKAETYECPLAIINTPSLEQEAIQLCNAQTYNTMNRECFVGNCHLIVNGTLLHDESCSDIPRRPFIYHDMCFDKHTRRRAAGLPDNMSFLP
eukprot:179288_1